MNNKVRQAILICIGITALAGIFIVSSPPGIAQSASDKRFDVAMKTIIRHEGGYSNDASDPGGSTNFGISLRYIKSAHIDPNGDGKEDESDIIHLTQSEADSIYYRQWFLRYHYDTITSQITLTKVMDASVNMGASQAHKLVKRAINQITNDKIHVDGDLDPTTIQLLNNIEPVVFHDAMVAEEEQFYRDIVKRHKPLGRFLGGWLARSKD
jgi:lysozyme family protein